VRSSASPHSSRSFVTRSDRPRHA